MKRYALLLPVAAFFAACNVALAGPEIFQGEDSVPRTHSKFLNGPADFQFAIVGDRNGSNLPGIFEKAVGQVNLLHPEFVLCVGDLVAGGAKDAADLQAQWEEFDGWAKQFEAPFFYVPGNHDMLSGPFAEPVWRERLGAPYYHFLYQNVLFLCLDTEEEGGGKISDTQAEYVCKTLAEHADVRWTLAFMHRPLWGRQTGPGWKKIEEALSNRSCTVFAGHTHHYLQSERGGHEYIVMSTTGASAGGKSLVMGELDHFLWVSMTDAGPKIANLQLDGIKDHALVTPEKLALAAPVLREEVIHSAVATINPKKMTQGTITFTLNNPSDLAMTALGSISDNGALHADPARIQCSVPPHAEVKVPVPFTAPHALPVVDLQPLRTQWTLAYDLPGTGRYEVPMTHRVVFDGPRVCAREGHRAAKNNWVACVEPGQLSATTEDWKGAGDASFRFQFTRDNANVHLKLRVTDDVRMAQSNQPIGDADNFEICLDARPEAERTYAKGKGPKPYLALDFFLSDLDPGGLGMDNRQDPLAPFRKAAPSKPFSYSVHTTPDGYEADITVANEVLDAMAGKAWDSVRVNVAVTDSDSPSDRPALLWWRPEWSSPASTPNTGLFLRK